MTATTKESATSQLAELEERHDALQRELDGLNTRRAEAERTLSRALADGAPEKERRQLSAAVEAIEQQADGIPGAIAMLEADLAPVREAAEQEQRAAAEAEADRLELLARDVHVEAHRELRRVAAEFAPVAARLRQARRAATEARRTALRAAGAPPEAIYSAEPKHKLPLGPWAPEFARVSRALESYGAS